MKICNLSTKVCVLQPEHKIQSVNGPLQISLHLVPKMLKPLVSEWAPQAFIVSFKVNYLYSYLRNIVMCKAINYYYVSRHFLHHFRPHAL